MQQVFSISLKCALCTIAWHIHTRMDKREEMWRWIRKDIVYYEKVKIREDNLTCQARKTCKSACVYLFSFQSSLLSLFFFFFCVKRKEKRAKKTLVIVLCTRSLSEMGWKTTEQLMTRVSFLFRVYVCVCTCLRVYANVM